MKKSDLQACRMNKSSNKTPDRELHERCRAMLILKWHLNQVLRHLYAGQDIYLLLAPTEA